MCRLLECTLFGPIALIRGQKGWANLTKMWCGNLSHVLLAQRHLRVLSLSLPLSLHVCFLSICFGVCAASCLNAATLFNGKKFTLPLASRKLRPRMGEAYVVAVPLAPLVALAHFYSHTLGYCCCFCWTFVQIEAMFLLPVPCAKQKPNKQLTTRRATNGWRKEAQLK